MSAEEAAARFEVPPGFEVNVFASEPDVQNPIAMTWDARGRLWIAENYTYADRAQRFDLTLHDRVLILEDTDGDGRADQRSVFSDQVQMLTGIEVGHGGVWLMCPPRLLFVPDEDLDDVPDGPAQIVLDGFEVAQENYHNFANGLKWGPDGWLYGRCGGSCPGSVGIPGTPDGQRVALEGGIWRFHPRTSSFEVLAHGTTNPWGHDWDEFGEAFFINTVNGHLWHLIPGAHCDRPVTLDPNPYVYELLDMHADHWHFDRGTRWQDSRDGVANAYGGGHAHCGMMIYLGGNWPSEYHGQLLTWNIHGRRANQEHLKREGSGYVGQHGKDLLLSADPFFRGMDLNYGPDGAVHVIDWSDTGECHEHTGVHRTSGRVFRVTHPEASVEPRQNFDLRSWPSVRLVELILHANEWYPRQARLILAERSGPSGQGDAASDLSRAVHALRDLVRGSDAVPAYRALVTLHAMEAADEPFSRELLAHPNEHLRVWAIRVLTDNWPIDGILGPRDLPEELSHRIETECSRLLPEFCKMARHEESGLVRLALASTLQRMPPKYRAALAGTLMRRAEDAEDHNMPLLVWYGLIPLAESDPFDLAELAIRSRWPKTRRLIARRLAEQIDEAPRAVDELVSHAAQTSDQDQRFQLLQGIADGLRGWSRAPRPTNWHAVEAAAAANGDEPTQALVRDLSVLFGNGRALEEVRQIVLNKNAEFSIRRSALETLVEHGGEEITEICLGLLDNSSLNRVAAKGLAKSREPRVAEALIENYRRFRAPYRPAVVEILSSRPAFAAILLDAIVAEKIPVTDLTAFDVRQIRSLDEPELQQRVSEIWGEVRESPEAKRNRILSLKRQLTPAAIAAGNPSRGRTLFDQSCAKCHKLFGQGATIGPDLTGGNRDNLDYLLENIVDPSAVVNKDFYMTIVETTDGRVLNGLVTSSNDKTLTLQTQTELVTIPQESVEATRVTTLSPMPDGLLDNLSEQQIRDLVAYLRQPAQVPLQN